VGVTYPRASTEVKSQLEEPLTMQGFPAAQVPASIRVYWEGWGVRQMKEMWSATKLVLHSHRGDRKPSYKRFLIVAKISLFTPHHLNFSFWLKKKQDKSLLQLSLLF
jgi:hypothetical protein